MLTDVLLLSGLGAMAAMLGAMLGCIERLHPGWVESERRHFIIAFGGGALLAAVSLVLVPRGMAIQPAWLGIAAFAAGGAWFLLVDRYFTCKGSPLSQFMAMMLDFVPEAIVVGALITNHYNEALFMAVIIAAQNFPEGFTAYRQITRSDNGLLRGRAMVLIAAGALSGLGWGLVGLFLFEADSALLGTIMTFCAGGIFYLVFRDIAPQARLENHWYTSFGAVLGFLVGLSGHELAQM